jgi:succinate dehydrogenase hydrophobic anchor subunit
VNESRYNDRIGASRLTGGPGERIGLWGWLTLYATGAFLFIFMIAHIIWIHFFSSERLCAVAVYDHYRSPFLALNSILLLLFGILHGMTGLRRAILDLDLLGKRGDRVLLLVVAVLGVGLEGFGLAVFRAFYIAG